MQKLLEQKQSILNGTASQQTINRIYSLYKSHFGKEFKGGCRSCYADCFMILYSQYKTNGLMNEYQLKCYASGKINNLTSNNGSIIITNANIGAKDEDGNLLVEKLLRENKGLIERFSKFPEDWKEKCGLEERTVQIPSKEVEEDNDITEIVEQPEQKRRGRKPKQE